MARGISESDVHMAADEIVAAGERPTVERIRAHLGTGSPNTVTRWLETWWKRLGDRLEADDRSRAIPDVPEAVSRLAFEWWALALNHARSNADDALATRRLALETEIRAVEQDRETFVAEAAALREQMSSANHEAQLAAAQTAELQRLARRLEAQLEEVGRQRDVALAQAADGEIGRQALEARIRSLQDAAQAERESLGSHVRAVEDRALGEIDRARQETKEVQGRLVSASRQSAATEKSLRELMDLAKSKALEASRDALAQRARADALEGQLSSLRDLPAALEAAIRSSAGPVARKSRSRGKATALKKGEPQKPADRSNERRKRAKAPD